MSFGLKLIACLQTSPWNFQKLQNDPYLLLPPPCSVSRRRPPTAPTPAPWSVYPAIPAITSLRAGTHASLCSSSPACCLELEPPRPCHARRRAQNRPRRRHLAVAVESPLQKPPPSSSERPSTTRAPEIDSVHSFSLSSLPRLRTPPPLHPEPRRAHPTAEPPFQCSSTPIAPTNSFASS